MQRRIRRSREGNHRQTSIFRTKGLRNATFLSDSTSNQSHNQHIQNKGIKECNMCNVAKSRTWKRDTSIFRTKGLRNATRNWNFKKPYFSCQHIQNKGIKECNSKLTRQEKDWPHQHIQNKGIKECNQRRNYLPVFFIYQHIQNKGIKECNQRYFLYPFFAINTSIFRTKGLRNATNELLYGIFYKVRLAYSEQRD